MTPDLQELLKLYQAEQECTPDQQAKRADVFKAKVKDVALRSNLDHWKISAYVRVQYEKRRLAEEKRTGKAPGAGLRPAPSSAPEPSKEQD